MYSNQGGETILDRQSVAKLRARDAPSARSTRSRAAALSPRYPRGAADHVGLRSERYPLFRDQKAILGVRRDDRPREQRRIGTAPNSFLKMSNIVRTAAGTASAYSGAREAAAV